jgi:hypothetical protein
VKKHMLGVSAAAGTAALMALFGTATAAANDYVGQTYADASEAMDEEGVDPIVATRTGDKLEQDDASSLPHGVRRSSGMAATSSSTRRTRCWCR